MFETTTRAPTKLVAKNEMKTELLYIYYAYMVDVERAKTGKERKKSQQQQPWQKGAASSTAVGALTLF